MPVPDTPFPHLNDRAMIRRVAWVIGFLDRWEWWLGIGLTITLIVLLLFWWGRA